MITTGNMKAIEGARSNQGQVGIVGSRFNEFIGSSWQTGAEDTLVRHGRHTENPPVWVPRHFGFSFAAQND